MIPEDVPGCKRFVVAVPPSNYDTGRYIGAGRDNAHLLNNPESRISTEADKSALGTINRPLRVSGWIGSSALLAPTALRTPACQRLFHTLAPRMCLAIFVGSWYNSENRRATW